MIVPAHTPLGWAVQPPKKAQALEPAWLHEDKPPFLFMHASDVPQPSEGQALGFRLVQLPLPTHVPLDGLSEHEYTPAQAG